jgi:hypothetical protein
MNWIEKKYAHEKMLADGAPELWNKLRSAIQDACDSYNQHYAASMPNRRVKCEQENGKRLRIQKQLKQTAIIIGEGKELFCMGVSFDSATPSVLVSLTAHLLLSRTQFLPTSTAHFSERRIGVLRLRKCPKVF